MIQPKMTVTITYNSKMKNETGLLIQNIIAILGISSRITYKCVGITML